MDSLDRLDDVVIFELLTSEDLDAFRDLFRLRRSGWSHADAGVWLFAAEVRDDLALLLREAQDLVADLGLGAVRFYLDGRDYVLEATPRPHDATVVAVRPEPSST
jgi:hypothetical protein